MIPEPARGFRRDVEGLRAVAVLAVVLYHAGVPLFGGGFVGVDVFFVISGFLITGLLIAEMRKTGRIALASFWARRARRLLPASAVVLLVTTAASMAVLPTLDQAVALADITAAALYVANWRFAGRETEYLANDTESSPVLHYWSLGVEEQFYLVWPLLIVAIVLLTRRRDSWRTPALAVALTGVWITSFVASWYLSYVDQPLAFFGLPTRAWQLATGGLVALAAGRIAALPARLRAPMGWTGMALIVLAVATLSEGGGAPYPGLAALLPTAGAAAVLAAGCGTLPSYGPVAVLGVSPMQHIGRVSYSWYLWHWPPLVLLPIALDRPLTVTLGLAITAASLLVAFASYAWIEQPTRHAPLLIKRTNLALAAGAALTVIPAATSLQLAQQVNEEAYDRTVSASKPGLNGQSGAIRLRLSPVEVRSDVSPLMRNGCHAAYKETVPRRPCVFGDEDSPRRMVLFGDSHAAQWFPPLDIAGERTGRAVVARTKTACSAASVTLTVKGKPYTDCNAWRERVLSEIEADPPETVIVSSTARRSPRGIVPEGGGAPLDGRAASAAWQRGMAETLRRLQRTGAQVVLIRDTPMMDERVVDCLAETEDVSRCDRSRSGAVPEPPPDVEVARRLGVDVWDLTDVVCSPTTCHAVVDGYIAWYDESHLSASYAATLADEIVQRLEALPAKG